MSNVKQLALAARMYTDDYDETLPACLDGGGRYWGELIFPYVKNEQLYVCPSERGRAVSSRYGCYGWNLAALHGIIDYIGGGPWDPRRGIALAKVEEPSATIMIGDANPGYWTRHIGYGSGHFDNSWRPKPVHNGGANFSFVDGHGKWLAEQNYIGTGGYGSSLPAEGSPGRLYWSCQK